jgi:hypothetical protein
VKQTADILQILLTDLGPFSLIAAMLLAWAIFQAFKISGVLMFAAAKMLAVSKQCLYNPFTKGHALQILLFGGLIYLNAGHVSGGIQYLEQSLINPAYIQSDTSYYLESKFEDVIKKHTNEAQFLCVRDSTRALAKEIGCSPSDIYLVCLSECGLNPFAIRKDGVAAGWIQFTRVGLQGLGVSLEQVKQACHAKDAKEIMRLTGAYIRRAAAGRKLENATDFYMAVFAPGKLGVGMDGVLYSGYANPEYYLNAGLDGYFIESGKVLHLPHRKDGKLTRRDLNAALEYKKSKFSG